MNDRTPLSVPSEQPTMPPAASPAAETATIPPASPDSAATLAPATAVPVNGDARAPAGYVIEKVLGRGGMGVVYKARSISLDRPCALKMILSGAHSGAGEIERFRIEAQAIARLQHPGIVQVYEIAEHDGRPFMALEYCSGGSLDGKLAKKPLQPKEAAKLVRSLAEAVQAAHEADVIHRDLKPANVLLTDRGEPKLTDFGLAKKLDEKGLTVTGAVMGTPSYMPPEQAEGRKVGPAADVYALGAILYECLTGRPPFKAATVMDTLFQVVSEEPVPPSELNAKVPRDLETVVLKCLQKDARRRYASAGELAADLGRYLNGEPIVARPVGAAERAAKWVRRNKVVAGLMAAVVLVLLGGVIVSSYFGDAARKEATAARVAVEEAKTQKQRAEDQLPRAEWLVYAGKLSLAQNAFAENDVPLAVHYLDECQWDLRGWEHRHLRWRFDGSKQTLQHTNSVLNVAYSPDSKRILTGGSTAKVWDAETGQEVLTVKDDTGSVTSVAFSPDGKRILTGSAYNTAKVWDAQRGTEVLALKGHTGSVSSVAFSPDGKRILTGSVDNTAKVWDAEKGLEVLPLKGHTQRVHSVAWSPDGKRILTGSTDKSAKVWDAQKGTEVLALKGHTQQVDSVAFSPDGQRILTGSVDNTAKVWDAEKGLEILALKGHTRSVYSVAFSPDGKRILTGSRDKTAKVWVTDKVEPVIPLDGHTETVNGVAFSPDGKRLFAWDAQDKVLSWSIPDGKSIAPRDPPQKPRPGPAFSPDGFLSARAYGPLVEVSFRRFVAPKANHWPLPDLTERKAYHTEQVALAEKAKQHFALAFHLGRLLLDDPDNADLKKRRDAALKAHAAGLPKPKD